MRLLPSEKNMIGTMPPGRARDQALTESANVLYSITPTTAMLPNHERSPAFLQPARVLWLTRFMMLTPTTDMPPDRKSSIDSAIRPNPPTCPSPAKHPNPAMTWTIMTSPNFTTSPTDKTWLSTPEESCWQALRRSPYTRALGGRKPMGHTHGTSITMCLVLGVLGLSLASICWCHSFPRASFPASRKRCVSYSMVNDYNSMTPIL